MIIIENITVSRYQNINKNISNTQRIRSLGSTTTNPNNPVVILRSHWSPHPAKVPIEGAVLFKLSYYKYDGRKL